MRDDLLAAFERLNGARDRCSGAGGAAPNAIIPAYTWGVQAQPITFGHYLSGYATAFDRHATRMREAYVRLNQSPLGAAALGTSSFPVDRPRLAELLGFDAVAENSLDANQISPIDGGAEVAGLATSGALTAGRADRRRHRAIRPDRTVAAAGRRRADRRQQHHAAEAQPHRAGAAARRSQQPDRRGRDVRPDRA